MLARTIGLAWLMAHEPCSICSNMWPCIHTKEVHKLTYPFPSNLVPDKALRITTPVSVESAVALRSSVASRNPQQPTSKSYQHIKTGPYPLFSHGGVVPSC